MKSRPALQNSLKMRPVLVLLLLPSRACVKKMTVFGCKQRKTEVCTSTADVCRLQKAGAPLAKIVKGIVYVRRKKGKLRVVYEPRAPSGMCAARSALDLCAARRPS